MNGNELKNKELGRIFVVNPNLIEMEKYIQLEDLEVYRISRQLSTVAWSIYSRMSFEDKKLMGDQFLRAVDSVGANIAEGYGRYHYMDKLRFYYNSRASHFEAFNHWMSLLKERNKLSEDEYSQLKEKAISLRIKLNNFISVTLNKARKTND